MAVQSVHSAHRTTSESSPTGTKRVSRPQIGGGAVAKYAALSEGRRIFAPKDLQFLPSEKELTLEIEREHRLIEAAGEGE